MEQKLKYWIALNFILSDSLKSARIVTQNFPSVEDVFHTPKKDLRALGLAEEIASALSSPKLLARADLEIKRLEKIGFSVLTFADKQYPEYLREIFDPPLVLYYAGKISTLSKPAVSIVGARKPTPYGRAVAERLALDLSARGVVVVSGLASGIDSISHWGALKGGKTVAVLGSGLERIYPRENLPLFEKIAENGLVLSEYPLKAPPLKYHFPLRNRIISGLSIGVVVVEGTKRSGSLITARLALEENREVMAVPGNITSELSWGTNWLIKGGAKLVNDWEDVVEEFPSPFKEEILSKENKKRKEFPSLSKEEEKIYDLLLPDTLTSVDELVDRSNLSVSEILSILLNLEIKDLVAHSPGNFYQRKL
ncbi:MAG: DNA-processing protein DprA [Candidatus Aminicenantes bacterium]|nr:MAG: DNA-processing protein DprA [Candidatus Aminicenantes bacterium]